MLIPLDHLIKRYRVRPAGVLHCGANSGEEAEQYDKASIKKVIWIEANPEIFTTLQENIKKYPGHIALNYCIGDENGKDVTFHVANNGGQSSSFLELGTHAKSHPDVHYVKDIPMQTTRIDAMGLDLAGIDFCAMDIQGTELLALKSMGDLLKQFKWLYLEINRGDVYKGNGQVQDVKEYVRRFGFQMTVEKWTNANWGDCLMTRK